MSTKKKTESLESLMNHAFSREFTESLAHNHPSGDPTPSAADISMTREIATIAQPFGISVHDHLIVGRDGQTSFRGLKLL